jgi:hypothetical protein
MWNFDETPGADISTPGQQDCLSSKEPGHSWRDNPPRIRIVGFPSRLHQLTGSPRASRLRNLHWDGPVTGTRPHDRPTQLLHG